MKLAWLTDLHLNFLTKPERLVFYQTLMTSAADAYLISGDTAEASHMREVLLEMAQALDKPIYFVLGNHDFYRGSIQGVRAEVTHLTQTVDDLYWLPTTGLQKLTGDTVLIGVDGFADGRYGDYERSPVVLHDSCLISELFKEKLLSKKHLLSKMQQFADEDAKQLKEDIEASIAMHNPKKVMVLTHVPPFPDVCFYENQSTNDDYLPYFASKATGDVLLWAAQKYPYTDFEVLCGHTHHYATKNVLANLNVTVGAAEYYQPHIQSIISV
jgi:UDP-2,3-diacylglucosamine pyrophosphatase LpxH